MGLSILFAAIVLKIKSDRKNVSVKPTVSSNLLKEFVHLKFGKQILTEDVFQCERTNREIAFWGYGSR